MSDLNISLTKGQAEFVLSKAKFPLFCAGYGAGKSHTMGLCSVLDVQHSSSAIIGVYEPYHDLLKTVAYPNVEKWLVEFGIRYKPNLQDKAIYTSSSGCGDFLFRSMENVDALVGYETYSSHIDELDTMSCAHAEKVFQKLLGRNRQPLEDVPEDCKQWNEVDGVWECIHRMRAYTTPEGFKFCYRMWHPNSENAKQFPDFKLYKGRTQDNPMLTREYIQGLKNTYPANLLKAYMEGEFVNLKSGAVYYNFDRVTNCTNREINKDDTLHIGIDFNVQRTCGIVFVDENEKTSIVAEIINQLDTPALIRNIKSRWPTHTVICYPDNSGSQRTSSNANINNIALLKQAGFIIKTKGKNPRVENRIASVVKLLEDKLLFVNVNKCPETTRCLEQQAYDDKGQPDKSSGLDHPLDAMGYKIEYTHSIKKPIFKIPFTFAQKS